MSFLQPLLLYGLPLALLPIIIHLINQHRHRTVQWAAMMFLLDAKKMTKGMARLRQILILAMRVLAILALIFAAGRPLASGWVALTAGSEPDSIFVLLDRSASMEQQNLQTGESKRSTALAKIADLLEKTVRHTQVILIDSATLEVTEISSAKDLLDLPATTPTDTAADIPGMLQTALDYITTNQSGRCDIWLASDLRTMDWDVSGGRWDNFRSAFSTLEGVRFYLLNYSDLKDDNLSISVKNIKRRRGPDGLDLVMDVTIARLGNAATIQPLDIPVEFTINDTRTIQNVTIEGNELSLQGHTISLGTSDANGWGRIDLPADSNIQDNSFFFVFGEAPVQKTTILSDDPQIAQVIRSAAEAPVDSSQQYEARVLETAKSAEISWDETALLFWHAPLPTEGSNEAALLEQFVASGKSLVLLPPEGTDLSGFLGFHWGDWSEDSGDALEIGWWRTESGLLGNTRNGNPLPLGDLKIFRTRYFEGESQALLKLKGNEEVIARLITEKDGEVFIWGTLPAATYSSMASDGVAFFVMIHRALSRGADFLANAQQRETKPGTLSAKQNWKPLDTRKSESNAIDLSLHAGVFESATEKRLIALNRPAAEDDQRVIDSDQLATLFAGLDYSEIKDEVGNETSLASEIWRAFLVAMSLALLIEAALSIPPRLACWITFFLLFATSGQALEYEKDIMPIFEKKCSDCHSKNSEKIKGGLRLDDPAHFQKRFPKDSLVIPGDWDASYLFITLYRPADHEDAMPPKGKGDRLTEEEVKLVQQWITEGAPINGERGDRGKMPEKEKKGSSSLPERSPMTKEQGWTNRDGKTILAIALRVEGDVVLLKLKNGTVYRYPVKNLSDESRAKLPVAKAE